MDIYEFLANQLINLVPNNKFICLNNFGKNRWFGFIYRGYEGLMSKPRENSNNVKRKKEGYFDIYVCTGDRYKERNGYKPVTHYNAFQDLLENSNLENCYRIWRGESPMEITNNLEEQESLCTLALLMFEQELNWGNEIWQRQTNFPPRIDFLYQRPRDMIMGFLRIVFNYRDVDAILNWKYKKINGKLTKTTATFGQGYRYLDDNYKRFFEELQLDNTAMPLMIEQCLEDFRNKVELVSDNKYYIDKQ